MEWYNIDMANKYTFIQVGKLDDLDVYFSAN